jgi:hypothetical protein
LQSFLCTLRQIFVVGGDILQRAFGVRMSAALADRSNLFGTVAPVLRSGRSSEVIVARKSRFMAGGSINTRRGIESHVY